MFLCRSLKPLFQVEQLKKWGWLLNCDHFWNFTFWEINWRIIHTVIDNPNLPKLTTFNFGHHFVCQICVSCLGEITRSHNIRKKMVSRTIDKAFPLYFRIFLKKNILYSAENKLSGRILNPVHATPSFRPHKITSPLCSAHPSIFIDQSVDANKLFDNP